MAISPRFAIRHLLKGDEEVAAVVKCLERTARRLEEWVDIYSVGCLNRLLLFPGFNTCGIVWLSAKVKYFTSSFECQFRMTKL